jgi:hypothetical protein
MSYDSYPTDQRVTNKYKIDDYKIIGYMARNKIHIILIILCALLLLGDFLTTSIALSLSDAGAGNSGIKVAEGNPFMAEVVGTPVLFLFVKALILQTVIVAAYLLRKEGALAYLPCVLVCSFYIWVNMNNINILAAQFISLP